VITCSLQSGSNGNSIYVEAGDVRLLFDAGLSGRQTEQRLAERGRDIREVTGLILTHEHIDHTRCAGILHRKFGVPIYATRATWRAIPAEVGPVTQVRHFQAGSHIDFDGVRVYSVPTPHDAVEGCAFIVEHEGKRLGVLTDLGHPFKVLCRLFGDLDAAYLESNYDPDMLASGPYTPRLQARIRGERGHLSNEEAATMTRTHGTDRLKWVAMAHLSATNNHPDVAAETWRTVVGRTFPLELAGRYEASRLLTV